MLVESWTARFRCISLHFLGCIYRIPASGKIAIYALVRLPRELPAEWAGKRWRRRPDSNRGIGVLQPPALPLGYAAALARARGAGAPTLPQENGTLRSSRVSIGPVSATTSSCSILKASPAVSPKSFTDAQSAGSPDCHLPGGPDHDRHQAADGAAGSAPSAPGHARVRAAAVADACGRASTNYPAPADRDAPVRAHARPGPVRPPTPPHTDRFVPPLQLQPAAL